MKLLTWLFANWRRSIQNHAQIRAEAEQIMRHDEQMQRMFKCGVAVGEKIGFDRGVIEGGQEMLRCVLRDPAAYLAQRGNEKVN